MKEAILIVSSYTAGTETEGIRLYSFNCETGKPVYHETVVNNKNPSFLAFTADRKYAYACQELPGEASIRAYRLEEQGRKWHALNEALLPGSGMCHITVSPKEKYLICSNFTAGNIVSCEILEDGSLGAMGCSVQLQDASVRTDWFQDQSRCHEAVFSPDGGVMVVANMGGDRLMLYDFDEETGKISPHPAQKELICDPGDGPRHHAFSSDGRTLYSVSEIEAAVVVYRYDKYTGTFERIQKVSTIPEDFVGWRTASEIMIPRNGKHVLISNRGSDTIACFETELDGHLKETPAYYDSQGQETRMFCLSPDDRFVIIANQKSNKLSVCPFDAETGVISPPVYTENVHLPAFVEVYQIQAGDEDG